MAFDDLIIDQNSSLAGPHKLSHCGVMSGINLQELAEKSPEQLMCAVRDNQSQAAFAELFLFIAPKVKGYLIAGGASPDVAEDVLQDVMIKVWRFADKFDPTKASVSTWIFTIARNARIDRIRKEKRPEFDPEDPALRPAEEPSPDSQLDSVRDAARVARALEELPFEQAKIVRLSFYEDLTHAQIAEKTDIPLGTVKSRMRLALEKLTIILDEAE